MNVIMPGLKYYSTWLVLIILSCVTVYGCNQSKQSNGQIKSAIDVSEKNGSIVLQNKDIDVDDIPGLDQNIQIATENDSGSHMTDFTQENAPKAVFTNTDVDVGELVQGTPIIHDFIVKNIGKSNLEILSVKPG